MPPDHPLRDYFHNLLTLSPWVKVGGTYHSASKITSEIYCPDGVTFLPVIRCELRCGRSLADMLSKPIFCCTSEDNRTERRRMCIACREALLAKADECLEVG